MEHTATAVLDDTPSRARVGSRPTKTGERKRRPRGTGCIFLPKGSRFYYICYYNGGVQVTESSRSDKKTVAEELLRQRLEAIRGGQFIVRADKVTFGELAEDVIRDYETTRRKTLDDTRARLKLHLAPFFNCRVQTEPGTDAVRFAGGARAASIRNTHAQNYTLARREEGAGDGTIIQELALLRRMLNLAVKNGKLVRAPSIELPKEPPPRHGFLEPEHYRSLLLALSDWLKPLVALAYHSGMRRGELMSLTWEHVRLEDARPHIRLNPGETKNGEGRLIPLIGEPLQLLRQQKQSRDACYPNCPLVFYRPAMKHERKPPEWRPVGDFRKAWETACKTAGVPGLLLHDLRRSAIRNLVRAGVPQSVAMSISGHLSMSVFQRYNITSEQDKADAMERVSRYVEEKMSAPAPVSAGAGPQAASRQYVH